MPTLKKVPSLRKKPHAPAYVKEEKEWNSYQICTEDAGWHGAGAQTLAQSYPICYGNKTTSNVAHTASGSLYSPAKLPINRLSTAPSVPTVQLSLQPPTTCEGKKVKYSHCFHL